VLLDEKFKNEIGVRKWWRFEGCV